jgi:DNA repair photolyase
MSTRGESRRPPVGRGTAGRPANRFLQTRVEEDLEQLPPDDEFWAARRRVATEVLPDRTRTVLCENDSPDIPFRYSINPYRGCEHGCVYCYARPGHEYLGMNAGIDFETRILAKPDAPARLRDELNRPAWRGDVIAISGVTDCYQPLERRLRITRGILEVLAEARQATGIVTKNALVLRDLDLLRGMAADGLAQVNVSVTTLDDKLARTMEPRTSSPAARLRTIAELAAGGVPVRVLVAPVVPGLTDQEIPAILAAAKEAGAHGAGFQLLRLPLAVGPIFLEWLAVNFPDARPRVESRIRQTRDGQISDSRFGRRMRGQGPYAEGIARTFQVFAKKLGLDGGLPPLDTSRFRPPRPSSGQMRLFE